MKAFLQSKKTLTLVFVCVFFAVFVMTSLTPMLADDFSYSFSYADRNQRMEGLEDILPSLTAHYFNMNGRMFPHGLTMLFLLLPKPVFNFFNALNACLLLWVVSRFFRADRQERTLILTASAVFLIWLFTPVFGQSYLWLDGSLNYSWAVSVVLLFLYPYYCEYMQNGYFTRKSTVGKVLFLILAFVAGAYSENTSSAGIFMAFCFCIFAVGRKTRPPLFLLLGLLFACCGFLFMILAPAESGRATQGGWLTIARNIQRIFEAPQQTLLWLITLFAVLLAVALIRQLDRRVIGASLIFFLGSAVSVAVYVAALYLPWRGLCCTTVFLSLACLLLLRGLWNQGLQYPAPLLAAALSVSFLFSFVLGLGDISVLWMEGRQRDALLREAARNGESYVEVHQYSANTKYAASYDLPDVAKDSTLWPNCDIAKYYNVGAIGGLPPVEEFGQDSGENQAETLS